MRNFTYTSLAGLVMLLGSLLPLGAALTGQFLFGLAPCEFCLLQRYPYVVVALCGLLILLLKPEGTVLRVLIAAALLGWLATAGLGLYHTGIEQGWVKYEGGCVAPTGTVDSIDALREQILGAPKVSCADATPFFLGISMASWNAISALMWAALLLVILKRNPKARA